MLDWYKNKGGKNAKESLHTKTDHFRFRQAKVLLSHGDTIGIVSKKLGVSEYTYYYWRKEYGGMRDGSSPSPQVTGTRKL